MSSVQRTILPSRAQQTEPIRALPGRRQLFIDDRLVESMTGLRRSLHAAEKANENPLIVPDVPGEEDGALLYGSVIRETDGRWRMWYMAYRPRDDAAGVALRNYGVSYAESDDGLRWRKPLFDTEPVDGQRTNRVMGQALHPHFLEANGVIRDPDDPDPERRYKAVFHVVPPGQGACVGNPNRCYWTACSPDGLSWRRLGRIESSFPVNADAGHLVHDPIDKRCFLYARSKYADDAVRRRAPENWFGRSVSLLTSDDFENWTDHGVVMTPDLDDPLGGDIYSMSAMRCGDSWVGFVQFFDMRPDRMTLDVQLAHSPDGIHWRRYSDRTPVLPLGGVGEWDRFNQSVATSLVETDDAVRLYYSGRTWRHPIYEGADNGPRWAAIGVAEWRRDGFVSLDASFDGGTLMTRPLMMEGERLFINSKADFGSVRVDILSSDGETLATSEPVRCDRVRSEVTWPGAAPCFGGGPRCLRFHLTNARLYSFWVE